MSAPTRTRLAAFVVASGILASRLTGLVREAIFARFFGANAAADVFRTALRLPNLLQNLLGEGTLSASFIPVYSELLEEGREEEAGRVAGAVFALLVALAGGLALLGLLAAPILVRVFVPGFVGDPRYDLAVHLVRILFPMTGLLVLSAWALGVLNSHRSFFVPYFAPVLWNVAMIATLLVFGGRLEAFPLAVALAWGALAGGALQLAVQIPFVLRLERSLRVRFDVRHPGVRTTIKNALPALAGRGVVQLSGYVDVFLASLLPIGAIATLGYAQTLQLLPVSLFGMSIAAAELPELARQRTTEAEILQARLVAGLRRIAFFVVPSAVAYLALGDVVIAVLYQRGKFTAEDTFTVWATLGGFALGLFAATGTRLFSSAFYALQDTATPARIAAIRVTLVAILGSVLMFQLDQVHLFGHAYGPYGFGFAGRLGLVPGRFGPLALSLGAGLAAWYEWGALRRHLAPRIGAVAPPPGAVLRMLGSALVAALVARAIVHYAPNLHPLTAALATLPAFGVVYVGLALLFRLGEARELLGHLRLRR